MKTYEITRQVGNEAKTYRVVAANPRVAQTYAESMAYEDRKRRGLVK